MSSVFDVSAASVDLNNGVVATRNALPVAVQDLVFYNYLKASLFVTGLPQVLSASAPYPDVGPSAYYLYAAYRSASGQIYFAASDEPGSAGLSVQFANGAFGPLTGAASLPTTARLGAASLGLVFDVKKARKEFEFIAGNIPADDEHYEIFPAYTIKARTGFVDTDTVFVVDTTRLWLSCQACRGGLTSPLGTMDIVPFSIYERIDGTWTTTRTGNDFGLKFSATFPAGSYRVGLLAVDVMPETRAQMWLDWRWLVLKKWDIDVTPANATGGVDEELTFSATARGPQPPGHRFVWTFGDQTAAVPSAPSASIKHTYRSEGTFPILVEMRRLSDDKLLAVSRTTTVIGRRLPLWKFTSLAIEIESNGPSPFGDGTGVPGSWNREVQRWTSIKNGVLQGALLYLANDTTFAGSTKPRGLYVVDGASLTQATVIQFLNIPAEGNSLGTPVGNQVRGAWLVSQIPAPRTADQPALNETYAESGSITDGSIVGRYWEWVLITNPGNNQPFINFPRFTRGANVTFTSTSATGTLTYIARNTPGTLPILESARWAMR